jgi:putative PEP-CTERM system TPR-repeat lipoprotein
MQKFHISHLLIAFILAGCSNKADPKALITEASRLEKAGDLSGALIQLKNAAQAKSDDKDVRLQLGQLYLTLEDYASAEKEFKRARQNGVDSAVADPLIAEALFGQHEYQRLVDELPLPDKKSAGYPKLLARKAVALIALDRKGEASKLLEEAKTDQLQSPLLFLASATMAVSDKKVDEAFQALDEGLKLDSKQVDLLLFKAGLLQATGKTAEATNVYKTILEINPRQQATRLALIRAAINEKRFGEARQATANLLKDAPHNLLAKYSLALIDFKENKNTEARDHLAPVLKAAPNYMPALLLGGAVEYSLGNLQSAQNQLLKVLQANPNNVYARRMIAAAKLRLGQPDDAQAVLSPLKPETSEDAGTLIVAGEIALAHKQYPQAEGFFSKAARLNPESAAIRTELGLAKLGQGDSKGLADLESAASQEIGGQRAAMLLILAHLKRAEYDAALKTISEQEKQQPKSPMLAYLKGKAYLGKNDEASARKNLELALASDNTYFPAAAALAQLDMKAGQAKAAEARFDKVLTADPKNIKAMMAHAQLALMSKQEDKYLEWLNKAARTDNKALQPRVQIALYYLSKRDNAKALAAARDAISAQPDNPAALELLGATQLAAGETSNAISTYGKLVEMKPDSAPVRFQQGRALMAAQQIDAAKASFEKALNLKPDFVEAQVALASLHVKTGRYDEAIKIARQVQNSHPDSISGLVLEGDIQMAAKQPALALSAYEKANSKQASGPLLIKQQNALAALGRATEGESRLSVWLKQHPEDMGVRAQYAQSLLGREQYGPAAEQYRYLSTKVPNNLMVLNNMAYALAQMKDKNAVQVAAQALKLAPDNPATLDTMGWALLNSGQATKALTYLRQALSKQPDSGDIHYHLAAALAESGDKVRARQELKQLMDSGLDFSQKPAAQALMQSL